MQIHTHIHKCKHIRVCMLFMYIAKNTGERTRKRKLPGFRDTRRGEWKRTSQGLRGIVSNINSTNAGESYGK